MKQPELGKKIAELRKAKGYTQEELVDKCNLSVRTLQRIESGEVEPRSHTIRLIFAALDYQVFDSSNLRQSLFIKQVRDLFNLKTNTMKKLSILTMVFAAAAIVLLSICLDGNAQSAGKVKKMINETNLNIVRWFNTGQVDSLTSTYWEDACLLGDGCGISFIRTHYEPQMDLFKFKEIRAVSITVADSVAVEKGRWLINFNSGGTLSGEYLTEWRRRNKQWKIINDVSVPD